MKNNWDIIDYFLFGMLIAFIWFSIMVVLEARAHHDKIIASPPAMQSMYPEIQQCDKELWLRIKDGC